jgi:hypothetical protein
MFAKKVVQQKFQRQGKVPASDLTFSKDIIMTPGEGRLTRGEAAAFLGEEEFVAETGAGSGSPNSFHVSQFRRIRVTQNSRRTVRRRHSTRKGCYSLFHNTIQ